MIPFPFLASLALHWGMLPAAAKRAIGIAGAVICALLLWLAWLHFHDGRVIDRHETKIEAKAAPAREVAADRRVQDAAANAHQETIYHDAIVAAPDGPPGPASLALGCERLRRAKVELPPACGPAGSDRAQAAAHR